MTALADQAIIDSIRKNLDTLSETDANWLLKYIRDLEFQIGALETVRRSQRQRIEEQESHIRMLSSQLVKE